MRRMKIEIDKIAQLAQLPLSEDEKNLFQPQLVKIVQFVEKLNQVETELVEPTFQVTDKVNELRVDTLGAVLTNSQVLQNAGQIEQDYIVTQSVFGSN